MSKYYVYHCDHCQVKFAVDQALEDHSIIDCPLCHDDQYLIDVGEAADVEYPFKEADHNANQGH